ncbi:MAG: Lrp/AsnC family transcriptional regulator [Syntrophobacteraceae bacterium]
MKNCFLIFFYLDDNPGSHFRVLLALPFEKMNVENMDSLDRKLICLLKEDGRISVKDLAERLEVTPPTVRARLNSLEKMGKLKVAGLIDPFLHQGLTVALIGLNIISHGKLDQILDELAALEHVTWAAVVTGRYDVIVEVVVAGGMAELYRVTTDIIPKVGNIMKSETFVMMKSRNRWINVPEGLTNW